MGMTAAEVTAFLSFGGGVPFGAGSVVTADVTASRARLANAQNYNLAAQLGSHQYNAYAAWLSSQIAAKATAPTTAQCLSFLGTQQP